MDAVEMVKRNEKARTKFKYTDRVEVRILKNTFIKQKNGVDRPCLIEGKIMRPHRLIAEQMIKEKIAEKVKK